MFLNGAMIGLAIPIIKAHLHRILWDQTQVRTECCVAARVAAAFSTSALPTASGSFPRIRATSSVFVVPVHFPSSVFLVPVLLIFRSGFVRRIRPPKMEKYLTIYIRSNQQ